MSSKLIKQIGITKEQYHHHYSRYIHPKYHKVLARILFKGATHGHDPRFTKQAVRYQLLKLKRLKDEQPHPENT